MAARAAAKPVDDEGFHDPAAEESANEQVQETVDNVHDLGAVPRLPKFERSAVTEQRVTIAGGTKLDDPDAPLIKIDDVVQVLAEYRCIGVAHEVNKEGDLIRVVKLRPKNMEIVPYNPTDPDDDGIVRAPAR